jgi:hypothetical protein
MRSVLAFTVYRLGIFVIAVLGFYALGARGALNLVLSGVTSVLLSYVLLRRQRDEMAQVVAARINSSHLEAEEDAAVDAAEANSVQPDSEQASSGEEHGVK